MPYHGILIPAPPERALPAAFLQHTGVIVLVHIRRTDIILKVLVKFIKQTIFAAHTVLVSDLSLKIITALYTNSSCKPHILPEKA